MTAVTLNVYDLSDNCKGTNSVLKALGTGLYHCGVEIDGVEYSFGCVEEGTGVMRYEPRHCDVHVFKQGVPMGNTQLSSPEVDRLIEELEVRWQGPDYHILSRNCCDFSNELCKRLGVGQVPGWVKSAAGLASRVHDLVSGEPIKAAIAEGKANRGAAGEDGYQVGDVTRGVASSISKGISGAISEGKASRDAAGGDYQVGDLTRGVLGNAAKAFNDVRTEGKKARDASESDGYRFGDLTRGLFSSLAKR